jgi:glycine betaine/proline transport system ATP-binding protein
MAQSTVLQCIDLWKVFGSGADKFMTDPGLDADNAAFFERGMIVGARDVNLEVNVGEIFVVMGLSGSGKSTLLRCMTALHTTSYGKVLIDGVDLAQLNRKELVQLRRSKINMVFQDFALLPHLTVLGNVAFPLRVQGLDRRERETKAREMITLVGLEGRETYYPVELSGGQQQRVGIARSLTTQPDVWFLDEPFSALDPLIRNEMQGEFLRLQNQLKKSIVFITHDFEEAVRLADRIAIMKDGLIIQQGLAEELILNPANSYVSDFTKHIPKQKVLRVRSVMQHGVVPDNTDNPVKADAKINEVARPILETNGSVAVIDGEGKIVGAVHRLDLIPIIM